MSDSARPENTAFRELETLVRHLAMSLPVSAGARSSRRLVCVRQRAKHGACRAGKAGVGRSYHQLEHENAALQGVSMLHRAHESDARSRTLHQTTSAERRRSVSGKKTSVKVEIIGESYVLRTEAAPEHTKAVAEYLDKAIRQVLSAAPHRRQQGGDSRGASDHVRVVPIARGKRSTHWRDAGPLGRRPQAAATAKRDSVATAVVSGEWFRTPPCPVLAHT